MEDGGIAELAGHVWILDVWIRGSAMAGELGDQLFPLEWHWN